MREIKFRGQRLDKLEFVYGDLIHGVGNKDGRMFIIPKKINLAYVKDCDPLDGIEIIPETVGQYTGLKDKEGKDIYEGDIVQTPCGHSSVEFSHGVFGLNHDFVNPEKQTMLGSWGQEHNLRTLDDGYNREVTVVKNIHDNPELLNK